LDVVVHMLAARDLSPPSSRKRGECTARL
jgi:hypothetical protein